MQKSNQLTEIYEIIDPKTLEPANTYSRLKLNVKNLVKKPLKKGIVTPSLYYDRATHFAFFPRQNEAWLNSFYHRQGQEHSKQNESRLRIHNSQAISVAAHSMISFAGFTILIPYAAIMGLELVGSPKP